ncbi:FAD/NAD(P)-binding domain-containing protein [Atractiella rhizophila]|nr:FAD/NAD(P)-binding domain-containing protein [Atractiella rhizophila]
MSAQLQSKKLAIIGVGASGIAALCQFSKRTDFEIVAYEARKESGGTWNMDDTPGECVITWDRDGRAIVQDAEVTPMYESLRTNIPMDLMAYRDYPANVEEGHLFVTPAEVLSYLQEQCAPFDHLVRYSTTVTSIHSSPQKTTRRWIVISQSVDEPAREEEFDFILIANGHYRTPYVPFIRNLWNFKGQIVHSKWYRSVEQFSGKRVLVVGNSASGYDIARELTETAVSPIYQAIRSPFYIGVDPRTPGAPEWSKKIQIVSGFVAVEEEDGEEVLVCQEGERLKGIEVIICATGYLYDFPFFQADKEPWTSRSLTKIPPLPSNPNAASSIGLSEEVKYGGGGFRLHGLDKTQIFWKEDPTLAFLALQTRVVPFPLAETQSKYIAHVWSTYESPNDYPLEDDPDDKEDESRQFHLLGFPVEFEYQDGLSTFFGGSNVEEWRYERRRNGKELRLRELGY